MSRLRNFRASAADAGFTLLELAITVVVLMVLTVVAAPSFVDFRDRSALRGAAEQVIATLAEARFQAVQRDRPVTLTVTSSSATAWCIGAREVAPGATSAACDCTVTDATATNYCTVTRFPAINPADSATASEQLAAGLRGVRLTVAPGFGASGSDAFFTIDPKTGLLSPVGTGGQMTLQSPRANPKYQMQFRVSPVGAGSLCKTDSNATMLPYNVCS